MLYYLKLCWLAMSHPFRETYVANICGHKTKKKGRIVSLGEGHIMDMPLSENGNPDHCLECIAAMSIKCAWCSGPIHIGSPVTLYVPKESFEVPDHAVRFQDDPQCLVGCLGWDCAGSGMDRAGFWYPPGKVYRVPTPMEMALASGGRAVIVHDLGNPADIGKVI